MRVGLTGGVASGKSTVARLLAEQGAVVIDADQLAREVVAPGTSGYEEVVAAFGTEVLTPDGEIDRPALGRIVFADPEKRRRLEEIIHPRVGERSDALEREAPAGTLVVHDIPLLVENQMAEAFEAVIVVDAPEETQVARMVAARDWTREEAESRIAAQASREERRAVATHVVDNSGTTEELREQVRQVVSELTEGS